MSWQPSLLVCHDLWIWTEGVFHRARGRKRQPDQRRFCLLLSPHARTKEYIGRGLRFGRTLRSEERDTCSVSHNCSETPRAYKPSRYASCLVLPRIVLLLRLWLFRFGRSLSWRLVRLSTPAAAERLLTSRAFETQSQLPSVRRSHATGRQTSRSVWTAPLSYPVVKNSASQLAVSQHSGFVFDI